MASLVGGLEAGGTKFVCAVGTGHDDVQAEARFATTTPEETLQLAADSVAAQAARAPLGGLGRARFGPLDVDPRSAAFGFVPTAPTPGWRDVDLVPPRRRALGVPVDLDTDVNGAALAEHRWGSA